MKKILFSILLLAIILIPSAFYFSQKKEVSINTIPNSWKIADNSINTPWAEKVDPNNPWPQYPRPDLTRQNWQNLNGLWDYAITKKDVFPNSWDGKILVPYPIESALSGVKKTIDSQQTLWYKKTFSIPKNWKNKQIILNFEASDWQTEVWINNSKVGIHQGGYDPFSFNISPYLKDNENEILVSIWDPTGEFNQLIGKQTSTPEGIFYTSSTGIWQTVWLEPVDNLYITSFKSTPNIDQNLIDFEIFTNNSNANTKVSIDIYDHKNKKINTKNTYSHNKISVNINNPILWQPDNPYLYKAVIKLKKNAFVVDKVSTTFGMRKVSLAKDTDGFTKIFINNKFIFQNGILDQGFWPDGLYTPPTEEAMINDLKTAKEMGFNMIRKHVKVESRRFYNLCDQLGILVWQDMPNGGPTIKDEKSPDIVLEAKESLQFKSELKNLILSKYNNPSIIMWIPFNEGWGQFETENIVKIIKENDNSRLVNNASGWYDRGFGDIKDFHSYPIPEDIPNDENRAVVLGEYGGISLPINGNLWQKDKNWGYTESENNNEFIKKYLEYKDKIKLFTKQNGLSASVYTQLTDIETETNGLMTYDRKIIKLNTLRSN